MLDYHMHCQYSADSPASLRTQLEAAQAAGLQEICFTDHVDFDGSGLPPADIAARDRELQALLPDYPALTVRRGAEVGMKDAATAQAAWQAIGRLGLDFIIGSVHMVDGVDSYYPAFFEGRTKAESCQAYLAAVLRGLEATPYISVLGHYDFCCKFSPYPDRSMSYAVAPALFDAIFRHLIQNGKGLEINTSPWRDGPSWGLDILSRYRALGGEFVTVGADAHKPGQVGRRIGEALELARAAGIPYVATFQALQPTLHRL